MKKLIALFTICLVVLPFTTLAQPSSIDVEVSRIFSCECNECPRENYDILKQNIEYTLKKLNQHITDTTSICLLNKICYLKMAMLNFVDSSNYDVTFKYSLQCACDTSIAESNKYNSLVALIKNNINRRIRMPSSVKQFIASPEFYSADTWRLPLLVADLDLYAEVNNLKQWQNQHELSDFAKEQLFIALVRLGDSVATQRYIETTPTTSKDWNKYIDGLCYASSKVATQRLLELLNNHTMVRYASYSWSDNPQDYLTSVRSIVLLELPKIVAGFSIGDAKVPFNEKTYQSEIAEKHFKKAKQWFKENPSYQIIRNPNYVY